MMNPAAIRKPLVDIPKSEKSNCPQMVNPMRMRNEMMVARRTMRARSLSSMPCVIDRNTGIVPSGLVRVKNEVRQMNAKGSRLSMAADSISVKQREVFRCAKVIIISKVS